MIKLRLGKEIDEYDAVVRNNGAPVEVSIVYLLLTCWHLAKQLNNSLQLWQNYTEYVGKKTTFRLLNRGSAKALDKVAALDGRGFQTRLDIFNVVFFCIN